MTDRDDFERRFGERYRAHLEDGVAMTDPAAAAEQASRHPSRNFGGASRQLLALGSVTAAGALLVAALALRPSGPTTGSSSPLPSESSIPNASPSLTPSPTAQPTPFVAGTWSLVNVPAPSGHPSFVVLDVSGDGRTVLFHDADSFDRLFVSRDGSITEVSDPQHEAGSPMSGRISPNGAIVVFADLSALWRYDLGSGVVTALPPVGRPSSLQWFAFLSDTSLGIITAEADTPIHPTAAWTLDLETATVARLSDRADASLLFASSKGAVLLVDRSAQHDNSDVALYLADSASGASPLAELGAASDVAVSADGNKVAWSNASGVWLRTVGSSDVAKLAQAGSVVSFAPDASAIFVTMPDGSGEAVGLDGSITTTVPVASQAGWVGAPR